MTKIKCPVCGLEMPEKSLIFHIKKRAVFEVYDAYKAGMESMDFYGACSHERYIQQNSKTVEVFKV